MSIIKAVLSSVLNFEDILSFFLPAVSAAVFKETVPCLRSVSINYYLSHKNYNVILFSLLEIEKSIDTRYICCAGNRIRNCVSYREFRKHHKSESFRNTKYNFSSMISTGWVIR